MGIGDYIKRVYIGGAVASEEIKEFFPRLIHNSSSRHASFYVFGY